jgi:lipopolysaccharide biosynthesis regulator YciM
MRDLSDKDVSRAIESMEAYLDGLEAHSDVAVKKLESLGDDESVRRLLSLLVREKKYEDAAKEALKHEPSSAWIHFGVLALSATGDMERAANFVNWARSQCDVDTANQATIALAEGSYIPAFRDRTNKERVIPGSLSEREKSILDYAKRALELAIKRIEGTGKIDTEIESQLLQRSFDFAYLYGERDQFENIVRLLLTRHPVPLMVAEVTAQNLVKPISGLVERLQSEHPKSFRARFLACLLRIRIYQKDENALDVAREVVPYATTKAEKEDIADLIFELSQGQDAVTRTEAQRLSESIVGPDSPVTTLIKASIALQSGDAEKAMNVLQAEPRPTDPRWLFASAQAAAKLEKPLDSLDFFLRLSRMAPSAEVFRTIANIAKKNDRTEVEMSALESLIAVSPRDIDGRERLAQMHVERMDYVGASRYYEELNEIQPGTLEIISNLAVSYVFSGKSAKALTLLESAKEKGLSALSLTLMQAKILESEGSARAAFRLVDDGRLKNWDDIDFLLAYMTIAYGAGEEERASEANARLRELHEQGLVTEDKMRMVPTDEVVRLVSEGLKKSKEVAKLTIEGKFPWVSAAQVNRQAVYWSWFLRTQSVAWMYDDPINRAEYSIYSTNGFQPTRDEDGVSRLVEIGCVAKGSSIVADVSALISLHALSLLDKAAEYFGDIYIPASYLKMALQDSTRLFPHQLSQRKAAEEIAALFDSGRIKMDGGIQSADRGLVPMPHLNEYPLNESDGELIYCLRDVFELLHSHGILSDAEYARALRSAQRRNILQASQQLIRKSPILVSGLTLETIAQIGLLPQVAEEFRVHVLEPDATEIRAKVRAFAALEESRQRHVDLWRWVGESGRIKLSPLPMKVGSADHEEVVEDPSTHSMKIARELGLPLLADDRVCQTVVHNERSSSDGSAFGTDALIRALLNEGMVTEDQASSLTLQMIAWRYRFLILRPEMLKNMADQYLSHPPGKPLRTVARYVHDCMRDAGLFGGLEPTKPPVSMAVRLYATWVHVIAEFIVSLWIDDDLAEDKARELTAWAVTELLPSPPRILLPQLQANVAGVTARTALGMALLKASGAKNYVKANRGLQALATGIGVGQEEYSRIVLEVLSAS